MINYTLTIPTNKKVCKNNSNVVGSVDYKSIALPTELQGQSGFCNLIFYIIKIFFYIDLYDEKLWLHYLKYLNFLHFH